MCNAIIVTMLTPAHPCREEFSSHDLSDLVTVECRDVCSNGFAVDNVADAGECYTPNASH